MYKEIVSTSSPMDVQTKHYTYTQNPTYSERYDSNLLYYKIMPTVKELEEDIAFVKEKQKSYTSDYVHLSFPENQDLPEEIRQKLEDLSFEISMEAILILNEQKADFSKESPLDIELEPLTEKWLEPYFERLDQDVKEYGELYGQQVRQFVSEIMLNNEILLAIYQGKIIGEVTLHFSEEYIEIDNFMVDETYQGQGVGSLLQREVLKRKKSNQKVILIVEKDASVYEMYRKQGYEEVASYSECYQS
ncbi:GNAT family N-acetyltransferase [Streptococcus sp. ZJ93]|uniref:GNAT family N-acetyltransferase n=1 Tax=Streptococcus handemini TaxID=3161188 RepID=UPI0032EBC624